MTKVLSVLLLMVLTVGVLGVAQSAVTPRTAEGALLFDNETGADVVRIGILFDGPITLCKGDIVAFGGGTVTRLDAGVRTAWIDAVVVPGGTLLINLAGNAQVSSAYWVSSAEEKNKVIFRWFADTVWNEGDVTALAEFMSSSVVVHGDSFVGELPGLEAFAMFATTTHTAFPDVHFTIEDIIAEQDKVAVRLSLTGTHTGPFGTIPATGVSMVSRNLIIYRFADGKIEEAWLQLDGLGMLVQMGLAPPMGPPIPGWGTSSAVTGDPGTPEENKIIASRDPLEVWNEASFALIDEIVGEGFIGHYAISTVASLEAYKQYVPGSLASFPDYHITVDDILAEGDLVVFRFTASATHLGPLGPVPATGMPWTASGIAIRRMADGKIVETWQITDMLSVLTQIGLVPPLQ